MKQEDLLKGAVERIVADDSLHAKWLNSLSMMENTGARKISKYEHPVHTGIIVLKHAAEEARHAYYLKKQIEKLGKNACPDYSYPYLVDQMDKNFKKIGIILGSISVLLLIVVIFLIDNTVRLAMFSNRFIIKTMQMVGATRSFITRPFDIRALLNGMISCILAVIGLWLVMSFANRQLAELKLLNDNILVGLLMAGMVVLGILISMISTHRSVIKYLKMHVDDLY